MDPRRELAIKRHKKELKKILDVYLGASLLPFLENHDFISHSTREDVEAQRNNSDKLEKLLAYLTIKEKAFQGLIDFLESEDHSDMAGKLQKILKEIPSQSDQPETAEKLENVFNDTPRQAEDTSLKNNLLKANQRITKLEADLKKSQLENRKKTSLLTEANRKITQLTMNEKKSPPRDEEPAEMRNPEPTAPVSKLLVTTEPMQKTRKKQAKING